MNMSPLELEVLRQERLLELQRFARTQVYPDFSAAPEENILTVVIRQTKQWFQTRQFRSGKVQRAHAAA